MGDPPSRVVERPGRITITHEQAERVVEKYYESEDDISITTLEEFKCGGFRCVCFIASHLSSLQQYR